MGIGMRRRAINVRGHQGIALVGGAFVRLIPLQNVGIKWCVCGAREWGMLQLDARWSCSLALDGEGCIFALNSRGRWGGLRLWGWVEQVFGG